MAIELSSTSAEQGPKPLPLAQTTWKTIEVQVKIEETTRLRRKAILNRLINHELLKIHRILTSFYMWYHSTVTARHLSIQSNPQVQPPCHSPPIWKTCFRARRLSIQMMAWRGRGRQSRGLKDGDRKQPSHFYKDKFLVIKLRIIIFGF